MVKYFKTNKFIVLALFVVLLSVVYACTKDKAKKVITPDPPDPPSYTHTVTINCNTDDATFIVYDNGTTLSSGITNAQGTATLSFTNTSLFSTIYNGCDNLPASVFICTSFFLFFRLGC